MTKQICLNMIVKDESKVIKRCLESLKPFIDCWVIVDTGSSDGTQDLIKEIMKDIPGELYERPWTDDFGTNRTEAIHLAQEWCESQNPAIAGYLLFMDADDEFVIEPEFKKFKPVAGAYEIMHKLNTLNYSRLSLVDIKGKWKYSGARHEILQCTSEYRSGGVISGIHIIARTEGNRSADPEKYKKDAIALEKALAINPKNPRNTFYLAQCYRDAGMLEKSIEAYKRRVLMKGWEEEVWFSLLQIAILSDRLNLKSAEKAYLAAYNYRPSRVETLGYLARFYRLKKNYTTALKYAKIGLFATPNKDVLFIDSVFKDWKILDEYAIACYQVGKYQESKKACLELLSGGKLPNYEKFRVTKNLNFALDMLKEDKIEPLLKVKPRLNLGCGRVIDPNAINVDITMLPGVDIVADLEQAELPLPDNCIESFNMSHVLEHIQKTLPLMQELYRVAKPDATLIIRVPHGASDDAFEDPTHVRQYFSQSFGYFSQPYYWRADYGYRGDWQPEELTYVVSKTLNYTDTEILTKIRTDRNMVIEMIVLMRAIKPTRIPDRSLQYLPKIAISRQ